MACRWQQKTENQTFRLKKLKNVSPFQLLLHLVYAVFNGVALKEGTFYFTSVQYVSRVTCYWFIHSLDACAPMKTWFVLWRGAAFMLQPGCTSGARFIHERLQKLLGSTVKPVSGLTERKTVFLLFLSVFRPRLLFILCVYSETDTNIAAVCSLYVSNKQKEACSRRCCHCVWSSDV